MDKAALFTGLSHIGLPTADVDQTVKFYEQFGFRIQWSQHSSPESHTVFMECGSCVMEIYYFADPAKANGAVDHVALNVTDIEAVYEYVRSLGYTPLEEAITFLPFYEKGVRFFTILGPNHEKVEFSQRLQ